jgi:hypothetical protein
VLRTPVIEVRHGDVVKSIPELAHVLNLTDIRKGQRLEFRLGIDRAGSDRANGDLAKGRG